MARTITSALGRFVAGALGITGAAAAGPLLEAGAAATGIALTAPAAAGIFGVIVAFAGGAAVYRGIKGESHDKHTEQIRDWLEQLIRQHGSLVKALANVPDDLPFSHEQTCDRIRQLRDVFGSGRLEGIDERLAANAELAAFIRDAMSELEHHDTQMQADLDRLIQMAFDARAINVDQIAILNGMDEKLDGIIATQRSHTKDLAHIKAGQRALATKDDLETAKQEMLSELRALRPTQGAADPSTDRDLVAAVERLARDAQRGGMTARNILQSENPSNIALYLAARRQQLDIGQRALNERIDEEKIEIDRELAAVAFTTGQVDTAEQALRRILDVLPDDLDAINRLGHIHLLRGRLREAERSYRRILELAKGDDSVEAVAYGNLGLIMRRRGDLDEAERLHRKSLEIEEKLGRLEGMANQYGNLGPIMRRRGDLDEAERLHRRALEIFEKLGRLEGMANQYGNLGLIMQTRGDIAQARALWTTSRDLFARLGAKHMVDEVQGWLDALPPE